MEEEKKDIQTINIREASIEDMDRLKEMGFDLEDMPNFGMAWQKSVQSRERLEKIANIVFINVPEKLTVVQIREGLWDFFALCGVLLT